MTDDKLDLIGLSLKEISETLINKDLIQAKEKFRSKQLWHWLYFRGETDFDKMTTVSKGLRKKLKDHFIVQRPKIKSHQISKDGTQKWLLELNDNNLIETVFIPEENRGTLCVSSQVGCTLNCKFCFTGTQKLVRNLTSGEIISQLLLAKDNLSDWPNGKNRKISNIVFMGMGEPLYNYENVKNAAEIMGDKEGIQLSTKRNDIVPINKKFPLKDLIKACREYPRTKNSKRITFEYVMLKGVNDTAQDARKLVKLISGIPAKINLIPFNPWPNSPYECSSKEEIKKFSDIIKNAGYASPVRKTRGQDIMAACGQLKSSSIKIRKSELRANG